MLNRPQTENQAATYSVRHVLDVMRWKQTDAGQAFMLNGQISTIRAKS